GAVAAGSAALGRAGQDPGGSTAPKADDSRPAPAAREGGAGARISQAGPLPPIAGRWGVLYIGGAGDLHRRVAYVEPGLIVPITEDIINLPGLTGKERDPIYYRGNMKYSRGRDGERQVIEMTDPTGSLRSPGGIRAIYRLTGEHLFLSYDST